MRITVGSRGSEKVLDCTAVLSGGPNNGVEFTAGKWQSVVEVSIQCRDGSVVTGQYGRTDQKDRAGRVIFEWYGIEDVDGESMA